MWLSIVWGVFSLMFLALGWFHWNMRSKSISYLQVSGGSFGQGGITGTVKLVGIDFTEFVNKFNQYIDYYNQTSKNQNKTQAIG